MEIIGLDLHKRESQPCIRADDGTITDRRIATSRDRFTAALGGRPPARILPEASTESVRVARHLESLGHEVMVADPNDAPMYANRSRRTSTDTRHARTLMDACETGAWRPEYRLSEARRHVRAELAVCDAPVRTRTRDIAGAKALVRRDGLRVPTSAIAWVPTRIAELDLSPTSTTELAPLFAVFAPLTAQIAVADARIAACTTEDPIATRLTTAPGVGPVTASAFVVGTHSTNEVRSPHCGATGFSCQGLPCDTALPGAHRRILPRHQSNHVPRHYLETAVQGGEHERSLVDADPEGSALIPLDVEHFGATLDLEIDVRLRVRASPDPSLERLGPEGEGLVIAGHVTHQRPRSAKPDVVADIRSAGCRGEEGVVRVRGGRQDDLHGSHRCRCGG